MSQELKIAIAAASIALSGVVISQAISILLSFFDRRHEKNILLRQKYEEMMFEFSDSVMFVQDVHNCKTRDQLLHLSVPPQTRKAYGLALLYFPNLVEPLNRYTLAQVSFYNSLLNLFDQNIPANAGGQASVNDAHKPIEDNLYKEKDHVMDALILNAKKYAKA